MNTLTRSNPILWNRLKQWGLIFLVAIIVILSIALRHKLPFFEISISTILLLHIVVITSRWFGRGTVLHDFGPGTHGKFRLTVAILLGLNCFTLTQSTAFIVSEAVVCLYFLATALNRMQITTRGLWRNERLVTWKSLESSHWEGCHLVMTLPGSDTIIESLIFGPEEKHDVRAMLAKHAPASP